MESSRLAERAIGARLREFRLGTGLKRAAFARMVGIKSPALGAYERGNAMLNYPAARRILMRFPRLSPRWLAEGQGPMLQLEFVSYPRPEETPYGVRTPFTTVFRDLIWPSILATRVAWLRGLGEEVRVFHLAHDAPGRLRAEEQWREILRGWLAWLPDARVNDFMDALVRSGEKLLEELPPGSLLSQAEARRRREELDRLYLEEIVAYSGAGAGADGVGKNTFKECLTLGDEGGRASGVKAMWNQLRDRLRKATSAFGAKAALARKFHVSPQAVSQWLEVNEETATVPEAETALRLLAWVAAEEAKQQSSEPAQTDSERKTRMKASHEKSKQTSPPKQ